MPKLSDYNAFSKVEISKYASEFMGTLYLTLVIKLSLSPNNSNDSINFRQNAALAIGATLAVMVYMFGYISWAMFNPAVTLAYAIRDHPSFPLKQYQRIILYWIFQFIGALFGSYLAWAIGGKAAADIHPLVSNVSQFGGKGDIARAFFAEFMFAALLSMVNIHTVTAHGVKGNSYFGLAIGFALFIGVSSVGSISGASLNPFVYIGTYVVARHSDINGSNGENPWIYIIAPMLGGAFAGLYYKLFFHYSDEKGDDKIYLSKQAKKRANEGNFKVIKKEIKNNREHSQSANAIELEMIAN